MTLGSMGNISTLDILVIAQINNFLEIKEYIKLNFN